MDFLNILNALSTAVGVVSNVFGGRDARAQADYQANATSMQANAQALILEQQAAREREIARNEERDYRRKQELSYGQMRAAQGASGVDINTGSPLLAADDFWAETELQANRIRKGGQTAAMRLRQQAGLDRWAGTTQADLYRQSGRNAERQGYFRAGSSLLTGLGKSYSYNN